MNMRANAKDGEDRPMADEPLGENLEEVEQRLREIQSRKRGRIRWSISRHTAEMALHALEDQPRQERKSGKARRRKRKKRLL
jgi:hypothetical protein